MAITADTLAPTRASSPPAVLANSLSFVTLVLAGLSAAAGGIHGAAMPEHAREHWLFGVFFAGSAAFQIGWAFMILRRSTPGLLRVGAWATLGLVALWFATRTTGVPIGPEPWTAEPVGFVDAVTVLFEVAIAMTALWLAKPGVMSTLADRVTPRALYLAAAGAGALAIAALSSAPDHAEEAKEMLATAGHARTLWIGAAVLGLVYAAGRLRSARAGA